MAMWARMNHAIGRCSCSLTSLALHLEPMLVLLWLSDRSWLFGSTCTPCWHWNCQCLLLDQPCPSLTALPLPPTPCTGTLHVISVLSFLSTFFFPHWQVCLFSSICPGFQHTGLLSTECVSKHHCQGCVWDCSILLQFEPCFLLNFF